MAEPEAFRVLVVGMGASAYGRERRAVQAVANMEGVEALFLISKWEDGSVSRLLADHGINYAYAPWGYLGRAKPQWTLVTLLHLPQLLWKVALRSSPRRCQAMLFLSITPFLNALPSVLFTKFVRGIPLVFYFGDVPPQNFAYRLLGRMMSGCSRHFVVNSEAVRQGLEGLGIPRESIRIIYNGVDLERFASPSPMDFRDRFGWPGNAVLVAFAGQLNPRKGVEDFLDAAALAISKNPDCRFLVFGRVDSSDRYHNELEKRVTSLGLNGRVRFTGWIERMEEAMASIDMLVTPSRYADAAPNVILEAMASSKPVIGARSGGIPELVEDGKTGILVEQGRPDKIADGLLRLAMDESLRRAMGRRALTNCRTRFDLSRNSRLVEEVLRNAGA